MHDHGTRLAAFGAAGTIAELIDGAKCNTSEQGERGRECDSAKALSGLESIRVWESDVIVGSFLAAATSPTAMSSNLRSQSEADAR